MAELLSPKAVTLRGNSAPHMPGPSIGSMRTTSAPILTVPDFMQATSASWRHGARSPDIKPRAQPASASSTPAPARQKATPLFMLAKMRAVPLTRLQRSTLAISLRIRNRCQSNRHLCSGDRLGSGPYIRRAIEAIVHRIDRAGYSFLPRVDSPRFTHPSDRLQLILQCRRKLGRRSRIDNLAGGAEFRFNLRVADEFAHIGCDA